MGGKDVASEVVAALHQARAAHSSPPTVAQSLRSSSQVFVTPHISNL
jgi:hypothetical protein